MIAKPLNTRLYYLKYKKCLVLQYLSKRLWNTFKSIYHLSLSFVLLAKFCLKSSCKRNVKGLECSSLTVSLWRFCKQFINIYYHLDTRPKLNEHKTFRTQPVHSIYSLFPRSRYIFLRATFSQNKKQVPAQCLKVRTTLLRSFLISISISLARNQSYF